ncbi:CU044_2847 family protein [Streptomyces sp. NPDC088341]|uniref:CU044_2847 family protein n=1 Tax=Streptomyces sp. NPDC088341 TaxID=3154870 RepID=UPI0034446A5E
MEDGEVRITRIEMPDGTPVWARISGAEELRRPSGGLTYSDTGFADQVQARVESLNGVVTSVARSLAGPLRTVRPDEVSIEFGIELTAKAGKVVGLLADGEAKGAIKVTLTWNNGGPPADLSAAPLVPPQAMAPPTAAPSGAPQSGGASPGGVSPAGASSGGEPSGTASSGGAAAGGAPTAPAPGAEPGGAPPGAPAHPGGLTPPAGSGP